MKIPGAGWLRNRDGKILGAMILAYLSIVVVFISILPRNFFDEPLSTVVETADGRLLGARIATDGQWRFPPADSVPDKFMHALLTFEDKRFRVHPGVDPLAVIRAVSQNISRKQVFSGASTISMQVIRMNRRKTKRSLAEKITEAILAVRLELSYSKNEILLMYASNAPFGGDVVGLDAASWRYFGRPASNLSWTEAATLAVLPNSPGLIHVSRNRERLREKRDMLLSMLHKRGIVSNQELDLALYEPLPDKPYPIPMEAPHLTDRVMREKGHIRAATTLDYNLQRQVNNIVRQRHGVYTGNRVENMAVLVADVKTGEILAYCGNVYRADDKRHGSSVDVITSPRSSGSIFKPFLYAAMLDEGVILPGMLIADYPFNFRSFSPKNFNRTYDGAVPAHRVLERSLNVPTVRMLHEYGINKFHHLLKRSGFTTVNRSSDDYGLTLVLGGAEATLWDAVTAYMNIAQKTNSLTGGSAITKLSYLKEDISDTTDSRDFHLGFASVWLTLESLANVNRPEEEADWQIFSSSRKIAWKTGTSYGNRDAWSLGVTPEYIVGVWVGNATGEGRSGLTGVSYAAPVMFDVFNLLPSSSWFEMPEHDMICEPVCRKSGHLAMELCESMDSLWIPRSGIESGRCPYHMKIMLDESKRYRVDSECISVHDMVYSSWFVLPPAMEWYYRTKNADYKTLPPVHPDCNKLPETTVMELIYPKSGMTVILPRKIDGSDNNIIFHTVHRDPKAEIHWHIDGEFQGTTRGEHYMAVKPSRGNRVITLVDSDGYTIRSGFIAEVKGLP
ncbi:MAG: penicillin-binding protein 1C [Rikenellaceae bacterium]|nr:penicillin-binding protein 1C [Rikenellaceae bacterium]